MHATAGAAGVSARTRARRARAVAIASAGQTVVSFVLRPVEAGGPWPLTRVLTALGELEVERDGVARALGDRRGVPIVHSQALRWRGCDVHVEARHERRLDELAVELPDWDELTSRVDEDEAWQLVDTIAAAADALFGSIGDGEPPETEMPDGPVAVAAHVRRHLALLLPDWLAEDVASAGARVARTLTASGLVVATR